MGRPQLMRVSNAMACVGSWMCKDRQVGVLHARTLARMGDAQVAGPVAARGWGPAAPCKPQRGRVGADPDRMTECQWKLCPACVPAASKPSVPSAHNEARNEDPALKLLDATGPRTGAHRPPPAGLCAFCLCDMDPGGAGGAAAGGGVGRGNQAALVRLPCFHAFHRCAQRYCCSCWEAVERVQSAGYARCRAQSVLTLPCVSRTTQRAGSAQRRRMRDQCTIHACGVKCLLCAHVGCCALDRPQALLRGVVGLAAAGAGSQGAGAVPTHRGIGRGCAEGRLGARSRCCGRGEVMRHGCVQLR